MKDWLYVTLSLVILRPLISSIAFDFSIGLGDAWFIDLWVDFFIFGSIAFAHILTVSIAKLIHRVIVDTTGRAYLISALHSPIANDGFHVYLCVIFYEFLIIMRKHNCRMRDSLCITTRAHVSIHKITYFLFHDQATVTAYIWRHPLIAIIVFSMVF